MKLSCRLFFYTRHNYDRETLFSIATPFNPTKVWIIGDTKSTGDSKHFDSTGAKWKRSGFLCEHVIQEVSDFVDLSDSLGDWLIDLPIESLDSSGQWECIALIGVYTHVKSEDHHITLLFPFSYFSKFKHVRFECEMVIRKSSQLFTTGLNPQQFYD